MHVWSVVLGCYYYVLHRSLRTLFWARPILLTQWRLRRQNFFPNSKTWACSQASSTEMTRAHKESVLQRGHNNSQAHVIWLNRHDNWGAKNSEWTLTKESGWCVKACEFCSHWIEQKQNSRKRTNFNDNILISKDANTAGTGRKCVKKCLLFVYTLVPNVYYKMYRYYYYFV